MGSFGGFCRRHDRRLVYLRQGWAISISEKIGKFISIGEGERIEKYDLVLPPPPAERTVDGVVVWSDGEPAPNARIEYRHVNVPSVYTTKPDREGRFSFKVYDGLKITIRATVEMGRREYVYSNYVEAWVMGEDLKVKIVIPANR